MNEVTLIIIGGFAGAGKTTQVAKLASKYKYPVFSSDAVNDVLRTSLNKSFKEISPTAYAVMWHLVKKQLEVGISVVIDAHMAAQHTWDSLDELKKALPHIHVVPIILQASIETHKARIEERSLTNKEHLNLGGDNLQDVLFKYEYIESLNRPDLIRIDANGDINEVYENIDNAIKDRIVGP